MRLPPSIVDAVDALERSEYTGSNRCLPCTVVNVLLALALVTPLFLVSVPLGSIALAGCLLAVYLRGYLVPGTPELTERYLPGPVLRVFGKGPTPPSTLGDLDSNDVWTTLETGGIVTRSASDGLDLDDRFRERWRAAIRTNRERDLGEEDVAAVAGVGEVVRRGERSFSTGDGRLLRWDSDGALLADVAAAAVLDDRFEDWSTLDPSTRRDLLKRLRLLLDRCPTCGEPTRRNHERVDPCCQPDHTVVWTECPSCGAFLGEVTATDPVDGLGPSAETARATT